MHKSNPLFIGVISLFLLMAGSCQNEQPQPEVSGKHDNILMSVLWTQRSAEFKALCYQIYGMAEKALAANLKESKSGKKPAVVLDLDETVLDNSPYEAKSILTGEGYPKGWNEWCALGQAKAVPGARSFLEFAASNGVTVFYISNRREKTREGTVKNLQNLDLPFADNEHVLLRTDKSSKKPRRDSVREKYNILLLIGDNLIDLASEFDGELIERRDFFVDSLRSEFGTRFIVMPNPQYGAWVGALYDNDWKLSDAEKEKRMKEMLISY